MAKPNQLVKVDIPSKNVAHFFVYIDNAPRWVDDVMSIEGVMSVFVNNNTVEISVVVDPRYNTNEVADEVLDLLTQEVPQVFK